MATYSQPVQDLIDQFATLPGIGAKSAERIAFHILRISKEDALKLSEAIRKGKEELRSCSVCFNITTAEVCEICEDPSRDPGTICVVEQPKDLMAFESTSEYRGLYHVLLGRISPLHSMGPQDLTIQALLQRVQSGQAKEIILATNPDLEGDSTALYLAQQLRSSGIRVSRIAKGVPSGSQIEHVGKTILTDALKGRIEIGPDA